MSRNLIIGRGSYARALGLILGCTVVDAESIAEYLTGNANAVDNSKIENLECVVFVSGLSDSSATILHWHDVLWQCAIKRSSKKDMHSLKIFFGLSSLVDRPRIDSLAVGLGLKHFTIGIPGHGCFGQNEPLDEILKKFVSRQTIRYIKMRGRLKESAAVKAFRSLLACESTDQEIEATRNILAIFNILGMAHLDCFCQDPSHSNGNLLRAWMEAVSTGDKKIIAKAKKLGKPKNWLKNQIKT